MRVLVTGGAGFIGSHTAGALVDRGYGVRILDGLFPPVHAEQQLPAFVPHPVEVIKGDVRSRATWETALRDIDAVFHFAAYQDYLPDFSTFFHTNAVSTALLYEVVVAHRLPLRKVIIASSQAVYGEGKYICMESAGDSKGTSQEAGVQFPPMREETQLSQGHWDIDCAVCGRAMEPQWTDEMTVNPHNSYAISKHTQETIALRLGRRYDIPTVCLRYSIVQGARQSFRNAYSGVLRIFTQRLLTARAPICYEDGEQMRDYVSVHDVTRANLLALTDDRAIFEVFNVGGDRCITVREFARLIAERAGVDIEPEIPGVYRVGDVRHIFSDVSKLRGLGWTPVVPLRDIVEEYIDWARSEAGFRDYSADAAARMERLGAIRRVSIREAAGAGSWVSGPS